MNSRQVMAAVVGLLFLATVSWAGDKPVGDKKADEYRLSGPYTRGNLSVFLIHGKDAFPDKKYITLAEALEQKKAVVHETKQVNEVSVENLSSDVDLYLEAGDIVKGGQQDRVLSIDLIVKAKSGKVTVPCFCVEASRWNQRGSEDVARFNSSPGKAAGKGIQLAAQYQGRQDLVWKNVAESQMRLSRSVGKSVRQEQSPTSLQLTQEDKKLLEMVETYVKELQKAPKDQKEVIGYAAAINGKVENFDVYGSSELFAKLWPRLLRASAIESVAALEKDKKFKPATVEDVKKLLADADKGKKEERVVGGRVHLITRKSETNYFFETRDGDAKSKPLHKSGK